MSDNNPLAALFAEMEKQAERHEMHKDASRASIENLFMHELTLEQLATLAEVFSSIDGEGAAGFWKGFTAAIGVMRHEAEHPLCGIADEDQ